MPGTVIFLVTTAPAPITTSSQISTGRIAAPDPIETEATARLLTLGGTFIGDNTMGVAIGDGTGATALTKTDAEQVVFKSLENSRNVFCVMQNRYSPPSVWLKSVMEQNLLGHLFHVQINCYWNRDDRYYTRQNWHGDCHLDGGTLFTQFSHFIDIMYWLFGDIKNISGQFKDFNHQTLTDFEDTGIVNFEFINEGIGTINYSTSIYHENLESSMTIIGEKGTIKVAGQYMNEVVYCNIKDYKMPELEASAPPNDYGSYKGSAQNHHLVIQNVAETLSSHSPISTNALEGMKVVDIIERIYAIRDQVWKK